MGFPKRISLRWMMIGLALLTIAGGVPFLSITHARQSQYRKRANDYAKEEERLLIEAKDVDGNTIFMKQRDGRCLSINGSKQAIEYRKQAKNVAALRAKYEALAANPWSSPSSR